MAFDNSDFTPAQENGGAFNPSDFTPIQEPGKSVGGFLSNAASDVGGIASGVGNMIVHPINTLESLPKLPANILEEYKQLVGKNPETGKYSLNQILEHAYNHPVNTALDVAPFIPEGALAKGAEAAGLTGEGGLVGKTGELAKTGLSKVTGISPENIAQRFDNPAAVRAATPEAFADQIAGVSNDLRTTQRTLENSPAFSDEIKDNAVPGTLGSGEDIVGLINGGEQGPGMAATADQINSTFHLKPRLGSDVVDQTKATIGDVKNIPLDESKANLVGAKATSGRVDQASLDNFLSHEAFNAPQNVPVATRVVTGGAIGGLIHGPIGAVTGALGELGSSHVIKATTRAIGKGAGLAVDMTSWVANDLPKLLTSNPARFGKYAAPLLSAMQNNGANGLAATHYVLATTDPEYNKKYNDIQNGTE